MMQVAHRILFVTLDDLISKNRILIKICTKSTKHLNLLSPGAHVLTGPRTDTEMHIGSTNLSLHNHITSSLVEFV